MKLIDVAPEPSEPAASAALVPATAPAAPAIMTNSGFVGASIGPNGIVQSVPLRAPAHSVATVATASDRTAQLTRDAVLSATPVRLLTMLYDRLLLDLSRAESAQQSENWPAASEQLQHAQAILAELSGSLKLDVWDGADGLLGLYTYVTNALMMANIHRDVARTREAITLLEPLRVAWHDAADLLPAQPAATSTGSLGIA